MKISNTKRKGPEKREIYEDIRTFLGNLQTKTTTKTQPLLSCKQLSLRPCKNRVTLGSRSLFSFAIFPWTGNARNMISYVKIQKKHCNLYWRADSLLFDLEKLGQDNRHVLRRPSWLPSWSWSWSWGRKTGRLFFPIYYYYMKDISWRKRNMK